MVLKLHNSNQLEYFNSILVIVSIQILLIISQYELNVYVKAGSISKEKSSESLKLDSSNIETNDPNHQDESIVSISRGIFPLFDSSNFFGLFDDDLQESDLKHLDKNKEAQEIDPLNQVTDTTEDYYGAPNDLETSDEYDTNIKKGWFATKNGTKLKPPASHIILLPGMGGSRLEGRWNKTRVPHYICDEYSDWVDVWINVRLLLPYVIDCLLDNLRLEYDPATKETHEPEGVEIRVKTPNKLAHIENLVEFGMIKAGYFAHLVSKIVDSKEISFDYKRDVSVLGAPYDFRRAPNELGKYFDNLKSISEENYLKNDLKPITLICHSMGCNISLYFLQKQTQKWKDKYIKRLISIGAPWAGSMLALRSTVIGYSLKMPYLLNESKVRDLARSLPSTTFLFPNEQAFKNVPLVRSHVQKVNPKNTTTSGDEQKPVDEEDYEGEEETSGFESSNIKSTSSSRSHEIKVNSSKITIKQQGRIYTTDDMETFFDDIDHPIGYDMWSETNDLLNSLEPPRVEVWCFVGYGFKTLSRLDYRGEFPDSEYDEIYGDGDGTVNIESARYCKNWASQQSQAIYYKEFEFNHMQLLRTNQLSNLIVKIISDEPSEDLRINA